MVDNNQQQEKSQDFELIELLFGKVDPSTSADLLDKSFEARFQSLVDQIQSYLHSSEKAGFFPHRFLGWFSSVLDTKLNDKLGIKKLHFHFEGARTLKVVAETESKTHVFIFTEDIEAQHSNSPQTRTRNFEFTTGEFKSVMSRDYTPLDERKLQIDVVKILKDKYELVKNKPKSDKDVKSKKLYLYLKRDGVLECKAKDLYGNTQTMQINSDELKGNDAFKNKFFDEIKQFLGKSGKDLSDDVRKELSRLTSVKGYTLKSDGEDEKINIKVKSKKKIIDQPIEPTVKFQEVTKKLGKSIYLEDYIEKLVSSDTRQAKENLEDILNYIKKIHTNLDLQANVYGIKAREADQHGFVAGIFDNFRYRDNTKLYLEQFAGRGYADIVLLVRGPDRAVDSVPILIELKAGTEGQVTTSDALRQAEDYIKGFRPNKMRILTNAGNAIAVGLNLDNAEPFKTEVKPIKQPSSLMEDFIELASKWSNQQISEEIFKQRATDLLSSEYYTFTANKETRDIYYFSRYTVGQSILVDKFDGTDVEKYVFSYGEYPLESKTRGGAQSKERPVTTLVFIKGDRKQDKTAFVFHIIEQETEIQNLNQKKVPVIDIPEVGKIENVIEITMGLKKYKENSSFKDLFEIKQISKYNPSGNDQQFTGNFLKIPNSDELKAKLDQAITSQHATSSDSKDLLPDYKKLLTDIADTIYPIKGLITDEAKLQAVLNGLLSSYSDFKLKETSAKQEDSAKIVIIPEFQTGAGGRVDMVIQGIGPSPQGTKEYTPIALEFKLIDKDLNEKQMKEEVDELTKEQNIRYAKGAALKTITDSDKMLFMGVVVNVKAKDKNSLILTSDEFAPAIVVHSSIDIAKRKHLEEIQEVTQRLKNIGIQEENLRTLESATAEKDYHYWLQQHDIADIARVKYDYGIDGAGTLFEIVGSPEHIVNQLQQFQDSVTTRGEKRPLTLIVNLDNNHWVTLIISHQNGQYNGYYADSLGSNVPDNVRQVLQQARITVHDVSVAQQRDGYNCGLWALENAKDINTVLQGDRLRNIPDEIHNRLQIQGRNEDYFIRMREGISNILSIDPQRISNLEAVLAETQQNLNISPGKCLPNGGANRKKRNIGMACVDSRDEEKITEEEKEQRIKELFNADKVVEKVKNIEFYDQLFKISQQISEGEIIDKNVEEAFVAKIKDIDLDSIDPEIRDIVKEMKGNIEKKEEVKNILRRSGVAEKIGKVAEGAGLAFTAFLVGKHIANGDIEGLGYDALNLWVMPKIGEKISGKILELGTKLDSQMLKGFAPVMGRAIGNFAAFLGLAESIKARQSATDPVDMKIADLNIATNSIFIAADVPAVVTETMSVAGLETGVVGEFAGPVGAAVSVAVIVISQFVEAGLEVEKLTEQMSLTDQEKHDLYWDFFLGKKVPDYIERDIGVENIYKQYMSKILDQFKSEYDTIAISLPSILITKEKYVTNNNSRKKRQGEEITNWLRARDRCITRTRVVNNEFGFDLSTNITHPFHISGTSHYSRIIPGVIKNYNLVCGPLDDNVVKVTEELLSGSILDVSSGWSCGNSSPHNNEVLSKTREEWSLQKYMTDCYNAALYNKSNSSGLAKMLFYMSNDDAFISVASNYTIDVLFNGKNILLNSYGIDNQGSSAQNRYYFTKQLSNCDVHKQGTNFFYIAKDNFVCNLGGSSAGQSNTVITRGNFKDSEDIHSVIGSNEANHIEVSHAGYVDGKGGNDVITAKNFTAIKGYFGDSIYGKGLVLLPINFSDIGSMTHANNITNIYNKSGAFISVDKQTSVKTADGLFVTPTKVDINTDRVTNVHITKLDNKLDNLQKMDNSNFNITKQLLNTNYHGVVGSSSNHIFYPDEEHHNFYWKAPSNISHLYLFDNRDANIMIAQANGILDFSLLNSTLNDMPFIEDNEGEIKINKNGLNVTLLSNYKDITVTFNGEEYYKLQNGELERDYCSHSLKIDGRFSVNGTDLLNHHNCFTFDSDKVLFLKLKNDLLLLSNRGALSISDYYSSIHKNWDLSVELNNRIVEPEEFGERADEFSSFRYYQPDEQGLQIYHNQPINKNDIGLVDLKDKSILDCDMKVMNDTLLLSHKNNTLVKVENWNTYQPAREMMFAFNDTMVSNSKCIASTCNSEDVIVELNKEKAVLSTEQLFNAVRQNNLSEVDNLLSMGADVNIRDRRNWTPLHCAADNDNKLDISRAILNRNADIEARTNVGETPLHIANAYGQLKIIELLVDKGASLEAKTNDGLTPLHVAIQHNNATPEIIEFLLNKGVNIEAKTKDDWTPLHYAVFKDRLDIVKVLSSRGANIEAKNKDGKTPLDLAIQGNYTDIVGFLKQTQLDKKLLTAIENGDLPEVREFVSHGASVNAIEVGIFGRKPIHIAAEKNYKDIIEFLLGKGVSVDDTSNYGWTPLHYTASKGCLEVAKFLVNKGANINPQNVYGREPIHIAAEHDNKNIIELLLNKGVSVNEVDKDGWMPLHWASWNGHLDIIEYLVGKEANINTKDRNGKMPLDIARDKGHDNVVEYLQQTQLSLDKQLFTAVQDGSLNKVQDLVSRGANLDAIDIHDATDDNNHGWTPILYAAKGSKWDIVKFLIVRGAKFNNEITYQGTPLHFAVQKNDLGMVQFLLNKGAKVESEDSYNRKPLHLAAEVSGLNIMKLLLGNGANVDAIDMYRQTPLYFAIDKDKSDVVKLLLDSGANVDVVDVNGQTPLYLAKQERHAGIVKILEQAKLNQELLTVTKIGDLSKVKDSLKQGADINAEDKDGNTPLHNAASKGYLNVVKYLIEKGASLEAKDHDSRTPIYDASWNGHLDIVKCLIEKGVNVNATDKNGWTPLHWAASKGNLEIAKSLIEKGADINAKNIYGKKPIHRAAEKNYETVIELLLSKGANVKDTDKSGWTPLHWASQNGHLDVVKYLVNRGAEVNAKANDGKTPLDIAIEQKHNNVVEYLEKVKEERGEPLQRKRRHHHGDHSRHHLSRKPLAIDSSNQPEIAASSGTRPSSWINDLFGWVKSSIGGLLGSRAALPEKTFTQSSISQISAPIDVNGTIMLLDVLIRKATGQKYISTVDQSISPLEAQGYALNITKGFEKVVEQAGLKSGVSMHRLNIDYMGMQKEITRKVMSGKFNEISGILKLYVEKACPDEEAGKLSPKKFDKFIAQFNKGLLNQSIEQILHNRDGRLEVDDAKQMSLEPQSYLSNASVHSHSKVSTCLSEIGVTKLRGNLNR